MQIAQQEIFGPVMAVMAYDTLDEAIAIANDTPYGLHARISGKDPAAMRAIVLQLQAGQIVFNAAPADLNAPFGGHKQSGNGREWGAYGFDEYLELKAMVSA